eukprot:NODE_429_length_3060_cov_2.285032.p1 GENE.NODE_429_length_3060_cov_2.285032~~NODE_429_length_3060_cov_2.285032.p1  ORF type:complete len:973 (-),score=313.95 NODE_429_length_3060_cov_2.285032:142-2796(-)
MLLAGPWRVFGLLARAVKHKPPPAEEGGGLPHPELRDALRTLEAFAPVGADCRLDELRLQLAMLAPLLVAVLQMPSADRTTLRVLIALDAVQRHFMQSAYAPPTALLPLCRAALALLRRRAALVPYAPLGVVLPASPTGGALGGGDGGAAAAGENHGAGTATTVGARGGVAVATAAAGDSGGIGAGDSAAAVGDGGAAAVGQNSGDVGGIAATAAGGDGAAGPAAAESRVAPWAFGFRRFGLLDTFFTRSSFLGEGMYEELLELPVPVSIASVVVASEESAALDHGSLARDASTWLWVLVAHVESHGTVVATSGRAKAVLDLSAWQIFLLLPRSGEELRIRGTQQHFLAFAVPRDGFWLRLAFPQFAGRRTSAARRAAAELSGAKWMLPAAVRAPPCVDGRVLSELAKLPFANTHGILPSAFGTGLLYYAFARRAHGHAVVLGSGGGVVPRLVGRGLLDAGMTAPLDGAGAPLLLLVDFMGGALHCQTHVCSEDESGRLATYGTGPRADDWMAGLMALQPVHWAFESAIAASRWLAWFGLGKIQLLHVDADHSIEGAAADLAAWLPLLAEDGVALLHDVSGIYPVNQLAPLLKELGFRIFHIAAGEGLVVMQRVANAASAPPKVNAESPMELRSAAALLSATLPPAKAQLAARERLTPTSGTLVASAAAGGGSSSSCPSSIAELLLSAVVHARRPRLGIVVAKAKSSRWAQLLPRVLRDVGVESWAILAKPGSGPKASAPQPDVLVVEAGGSSGPKLIATVHAWAAKLAVDGVLLADCAVASAGADDVVDPDCGGLLGWLEAAQAWPGRHGVEFLHLARDGVIFASAHGENWAAVFAGNTTRHGPPASRPGQRAATASAAPVAPAATKSGPHHGKRGRVRKSVR